MAVSRADVALAEARMLIENRVRWPAAPLIGAGEQWLRPGTVADMAGRLAETDESMAAIREAIRPVGVLDALAILDQHAEFVADRAAELRRLQLNEAAVSLEAEYAMAGDDSWRKVRAQFDELAMARVMAERPPVPAWVAGDGDGWTSIAVATRWGADDETLDALGALLLVERLDEIELAQRQTQARIAWLRRYRYPLPTGGDDSGPFAEANRAAHSLTRVHAEATAALGRSEIPREWEAATIPRRLADRLATKNPKLFGEMMTRAVPVIVVDTAAA
ncbi:MAG: hypothetical protein OXB97_08525 [Rhodospirillales bacterium]|nr:hypothetical protein [Rhodospirillales bacterium]